MQAKHIFILFGLALAFGWLVPDLETAAQPASSGPVVEAKTDDAQSWNITEDADETVLARQGDGHFYADVDVNGDEIRFMIDTGASGIALTAQDAETLGFTWSDDELGVVGRGVSGDVYGKQVRLQSVQLGDLEIAEVDAVIIPSGLDVSLLGQSFLSKAGTVTIENDEMVIS